MLGLTYFPIVEDKKKEILRGWDAGSQHISFSLLNYVFVKVLWKKKNALWLTALIKSYNFEKVLKHANN